MSAVGGMSVVDRPDRHRYDVLVDGREAGFAEYRRTPGRIAFTHTVVDPAFEGRGVGSFLARQVLDTAREHGDAVLPFCPFIREWMTRHPGYVDLVPPDRRAQFGFTDDAGGAA